MPKNTLSQETVGFSPHATKSFGTNSEVNAGSISVDQVSKQNSCTRAQHRFDQTFMTNSSSGSQSSQIELFPPQILRKSTSTKKQYTKKPKLPITDSKIKVDSTVENLEVASMLMLAKETKGITSSAQRSQDNLDVEREHEESHKDGTNPLRDLPERNFLEETHTIDEGGSDTKSPDADDLHQDISSLAVRKKGKIMTEITDGNEVHRDLESSAMRKAPFVPRRPRKLLLRALNSEQKSPRKTALSPFSGPDKALIIKRIPETGPQNTVYFPIDGPQTSLRNRLNQLKDVITRDHLAKRKFQLRDELLTLKNSLEERQKEDAEIETGDIGNTATTASLSNSQGEQVCKKTLEKRKDEAKAFFDLSYWKHFVTKQEHILAGVDNQVDENTKALRGCDTAMATTLSSMKRSRSMMASLEARSESVTGMIYESMTKLLHARKHLKTLELEDAGTV